MIVRSANGAASTPLRFSAAQPSLMHILSAKFVRSSFVKTTHGRTRAVAERLLIQSLSPPYIAFWEFEYRRSVVKNYIEQRFSNPDAAVVLNKAELAKAVHEEADTGSRGADHSRQSVLRDLWN
jgi:hypothetical protein